MNSYDTFIIFVFGATVVGLSCIPIVAKFIGSLVSPYLKANVNKRLFAAGLDATIGSVCFAIFAPSSLIES